MIRALQPIRDAFAGRYRLHDELGRGTMATVFAADGVGGERLAIKVLHREIVAALGPDRFQREVDLLSRLRHPRIVPVLDSGAVGPYLYLVMPYVPGETLRVRLERSGPLPLDAVLGVAADVADALDCAHRERIIHRDIKPENLLLDEGRAQVCDFGLARALGEAALEPVSSSGLVIGTPAYMSPEQAMGRDDLGPASDIYSLGCVVYEMLAGELPFTGPTPQAVIARHVAERPRPLRTVRADLPRRVEAAVLAALDKSPERRPATGAAFVAALAGGASRGHPLLRGNATRDVAQLRFPCAMLSPAKTSTRAPRSVPPGSSDRQGLNGGGGGAGGRPGPPGSHFRMTRTRSRLTRIFHACCFRSHFFRLAI
ncbi:MAG: serine/threonine protein kinase [Gemmatimonadales bacterium]|nr:serine/threonine protein kinase [Gemmatimonadales bacterium]